MGYRVLAERETNHNHPIFFQRFLELPDHCAAVFDSLEATPQFGKGIVDIVVVEGDVRKERHQLFTLSQAKLLLRLQYSSQRKQRVGTNATSISYTEGESIIINSNG